MNTRSHLESRISWLQFFVLLVIVTMLMPGCSASSKQSNSRSPYAHDVETPFIRNPQEAQRLTLKAVDLMDSDPEQAQQLLLDALAADLYHGPAHNNLGVLYLEDDRLYDAANEFEWARKLMPGHPDPRLNLGLTLELAGKIDEAEREYESALDVYPGHLPTVQALARLQIRNARADERTHEFLDEIALRSESNEWREWAHKTQQTTDHR